MSKKLTIVILTLLALVLAATALASTTLYVNTSNGKNLNVRDGDSKNAKVIDSIRNGTRVTVDYYTDGNSWAHITYGARSGYVMSRFLKSTPGTTVASTSTTTTTRTTTSSVGNGTTMDSVTPYTVIVRPNRASGRVALRSGPSTDYAVIQYFPDGSELKVVAENRYWAQVIEESTGVTGYMYREYLQTKYEEAVTADDHG